jgi:hypothetical protein
MSEEEELKKLKRDIKGLLESNRLDWQEYALKVHTGEDRRALRKAIEDRNAELSELVPRKWKLEAKLKKK